jgi:hypothetical protein
MVTYLTVRLLSRSLVCIVQNIKVAVAGNLSCVFPSDILCMCAEYHVLVPTSCGLVGS